MIIRNKTFTLFGFMSNINQTATRRRQSLFKTDSFRTQFSSKFSYRKSAWVEATTKYKEMSLVSAKLFDGMGEENSDVVKALNETRH